MKTTYLPHLAGRVFGTPLLIQPQKLGIILHAIGPRLGLGEDDVEIDLGVPVAGTPLEDATGLERKPYSVEDGIAVIGVSGTLVKRASWMDAESGLQSYDAIRAQLRDAVADPRIKGILLDVDSPGGEVGGLFVLDCIASGTLWVDMRALGVDVLISAPQKSWSGPPCAGLVMLGERAVERLAQTTSTSFACDLGKWRQIMAAYENGGHAYHATMPTDALTRARDMMLETERDGFEVTRTRQVELGRRVRALLESRGYPSVAAPGFQAPGVVVSYTDDPEIQSSRRFLGLGLQTAAGVPLQCDEGADFRTFRIGLFGLEKWHHVDRTVAHLAAALDRLGIHAPQREAVATA